MQDIESEIDTLTHQWIKQLGGMNILVPIGAALNVLTTVGLQAPEDVRRSMVQFLHVVANRLEAIPH